MIQENPKEIQDNQKAVRLLGTIHNPVQNQAQPPQQPAQLKEIYEMYSKNQVSEDFQEACIQLQLIREASEKILNILRISIQTYKTSGKNKAQHNKLSISLREFIKIFEQYSEEINQIQHSMKNLSEKIDQTKILSSSYSSDISFIEEGYEIIHQMITILYEKYKTYQYNSYLFVERLIRLSGEKFSNKELEENLLIEIQDELQEIQDSL